MESPQIENGHLKIANELFEAIISNMPCRIPGPMAIFLAVMRETYGFNRKSAEISTERLKKLTGIDKRQNIHRAIKEAIQCNLISVIKNDYRTNPTYSINKHYSKWCSVIKNDDVIKNDYACNQKRLRSSSKMITNCILKTPSKDTYKDSTPIPEDFVLTPGLKAFAIKKGIPENSIENWFDAFVNKYKANGDSRKNWAAAWFAYISAVSTNPKNKNNTQIFDSKQETRKLDDQLRKAVEREKYLRGET